ncbi:MAG: hypothetical protein WCT85_06985 [Parachlamydiales bacterium]|jgi:hypothetical protein
MFTDEELLRLNQEGFIAGPNENERDFLKRMDLSKKILEDPKIFFTKQQQAIPFDLENRILKPRWNWTRAQLLSLFDVTAKDLALFYSDEKLNFFQAAATWIITLNENVKIPILQFRNKLRNKPYLFIYTLDEILAHEAVHGIRVAFDEPKTEEFFSYMTSTNVFRKVLGPIVKNSNEVITFLAFLLSYFVFYVFWISTSFDVFKYFSAFFGLLTIGIVGLGMIRLFYIRRKISKAFKKMFKILGDKKFARAVLFRCTDDEIFRFAKMKKSEISKYFENSKNLSLRLKMIYLAYFKNIKSQI